MDQVLEPWYREKADFDAIVIIRREKIAVIPECEFKDTLVMNGETTSSSECPQSKVAKDGEKTGTKSVEKKNPKKKLVEEEKKNGDEGGKKIKVKKDNVKPNSDGAGKKKSKSLKKNEGKDLEICEKPLETAKNTECVAIVAPVAVATEENKFVVGVFKCPDHKCALEFEDSKNLLDHVASEHSLICRIPYCTYSCYNFQDYSMHFQSIHCLSTHLPNKRGPITTVPALAKHAKLTS